MKVGVDGRRAGCQKAACVCVGRRASMENTCHVHGQGCLTLCPSEGTEDWVGRKKRRISQPSEGGTFCSNEGPLDLLPLPPQTGQLM